MSATYCPVTTLLGGTPRVFQDKIPVVQLTIPTPAYLSGSTCCYYPCILCIFLTLNNFIYLLKGFFKGFIVLSHLYTQRGA